MHNLLGRWLRRRLGLGLGLGLAGRAPSVGPAAGGAALAGPNVSADESAARLALRALFRRPEFSVRDGLDDYDEDFTSFQLMGDLVTHDMRRMAERATRESGAGSDDSAEDHPEEGETKRPSGEPSPSAATRAQTGGDPESKA
jgi:hypothetical protein